LSIYPLVRLDSVARVVRGVTYGKGDVVQSPGPGDVPVLRAGNINGRLITDRDLVWLPRRAVSDDQILKAGDVVMCMSSGSASVVGKSAQLNTEWVGSFGAFCAAVRTEPLRADPGFIAHVLATPAFRAFAGAALGNNIKNLNKSALEGYRIPLPPLDEQRRIVGLLDRAAEIRRRADAARAKARAIIPALFLDTFGDPATNPKGWPTAELGKHADVQGGVQVSAKRAALPLELPYLRVANVMRGRLDLSEIKMIRVTASEARRTNLVPGDVLVVEGHGNPNEIGRAAVWDGSIATCTHQNHLIRVRPGLGSLTPEYVETFLNSDVGRRILIQNGKTTSGLNTISTRNVKEVRIPLPPTSLQGVFAEQVQRIDSLARHLDAAAAKAEAMAAGLSAEVFG
jgi:type I restriction enzyme S subunit